MAIRSPRHSIALCLATGAVAAVGCWYVFSGPGQHRVVNALAPADALISATAHATDRSIVSNAGMPSPLAGSSVPRLPLDSRGHLARTRAVRDFFDYFLTAQSDETPTALDALVTHAIAMQLEGTMAQAEALDVWKRYRAYFDALAQSTGTGATPGDRLDPAALQLALDQRATLASRTLGEWSAPFFGAEQERQRYGLERLKIARDPSLNDAQKRERLTALEQLLPPEQRAEAARAQAQQDAVGAISQLQKQAATPDEMHAQIAQQLGPEVAMRAAQMQRDDDAWQAKYRDYATQRAQIDAQQLAPAERDAQVAQLRASFFTGPGELQRAASLDYGTENASGHD